MNTLPSRYRFRSLYSLGIGPAGQELPSCLYHAQVDYPTAWALDQQGRSSPRASTVPSPGLLLLSLQDIPGHQDQQGGSSPRASTCPGRLPSLPWANVPAGQELPTCLYLAQDPLHGHPVSSHVVIACQNHRMTVNQNEHTTNNQFTVKKSSEISASSQICILLLFSSNNASIFSYNLVKLLRLFTFTLA